MRGDKNVGEIPSDVTSAGVILADTSAWVEYDPHSGSAVDQRLAELIRDDGSLAVAEPILMEVMAGARDDARQHALRRLLLRLDLLASTPQSTSTPPLASTVGAAERASTREGWSTASSPPWPRTTRPRPSPKTFTCRRPTIESVEASDLVAAYAAAWESGDPKQAWSFYADHVVMRLPGRGALAGEHRGREAVIAAIQALLARTSDASAEVQVLDRLVSGDRVALVLREAAARGDDRLELRRVNLYRVEAGKIVEIEIYEANQYEVDDFFG